MSTLLLGIIFGLAFGVLSVAMMAPLSLPDKRRALAGAFANRFGVGLVIAIAQLPFPGWLTGLSMGLLLSLPDAIITKSWAPILGLGAVGGVILGLIRGAVAG